MRRWATIGVLLLGLVLAGATACNPFGGDEEEASQQLVEVVWGDLTVSVSGSGSIDISNEVRLAFGVGGRIDKIYVEEGDNITEGDMLTRLDTISLEQAVKTAELAVKTAEVDLELAMNDYRKITYPYTYSTWVFDVPMSVALISDAQRELNEALEVMQELGLSREQYDWEQHWEVWRQLKRAQDSLIEAREKLARGYGEDVFGSQILPMKDFWTLRAAELAMEKAQLAKEKAQLALDEANDELEKAVIIAPFDGVVASVGAEEGDTVLTTTTIIHLIDLTSMELKAEVDEIDVAEVKPGQRVIIEVDALPALQLDGEVISISLLPEVEEGVVLYEVKIGFDVPEGSGLRAGMSATADIVIDERSDVLLVPDRAIKQDSLGNTVVSVMVNGQLQERPVVIGISDGYQTEIVDGLDEGEVVLRKAS